ncbi:MAG: hypothetical protein UR28_C0003G0018 [Candidatus Peregrinibacteria bacterium GW2011_GWF2_33_10]|nr:MAG: hypothetical protein UR28_C0003G0018 [Candidatus Peregrinibacteria bacterium GW2011_GWF2_33_10]
MSEEKRKLRHDILNCLAVLKANVDLLGMEKNSQQMAEDMSSAIEELEQKIPLMIEL